ncbi:hypothetical protein ACJJIC_18035 [Microbulbifer sp. ANSA002]|uniref:hypothetical protein n=1 Tax=unclassified Microbulbifer TaxID=2619833 RepID=UPI004040F1D4
MNELGCYRSASRHHNAEFLILSHNGESSHGRYSPLYADIWSSGIDGVIVDSGGPYKHGDESRYKWFRASIGHNLLSYGMKNSLDLGGNSTSVGSDRSRLQSLARFSFSTHARSVIAEDKSIVFNEAVPCIKRRKIYNNFSSNLEVVNLDSYLFKPVFSSCSLHLKEDAPLKYGDIDNHLEETPRCTGHSKTVAAQSRAFSLGVGLTSCSVRIFE